MPNILHAVLLIGVFTLAGCASQITAGLLVVGAGFTAAAEQATALKKGTHGP